MKDDASTSEPKPNYLTAGDTVKSWLLTVDHKKIGIAKSSAAVTRMQILFIPFTPYLEIKQNMPIISKLFSIELSQADPYTANRFLTRSEF